MSFDGGSKVVILDEADYLDPQSTQPALRAFIEEFEKHCTFILTCNYANRIISPLHSRCQVIDFKVIADDKQRMAGAFMRRIGYILDEEKIEYVLDMHYHFLSLSIFLPLLFGIPLVSALLYTPLSPSS